MSFNYWYRFSEAIYQTNSSPLTDLFIPYINRLVLILCKHCEIDSDHVKKTKDISILGKLTISYTLARYNWC